MELMLNQMLNSMLNMTDDEVSLMEKIFKTNRSCEIYEEKFENNDLSESLRQKGNAIFKSAGADKEKILAAIRLYTEAIENGGLGSNQLPLAYSNRATALYKYGYYAEAYDDCCLALDYGIVKELKAKVHVRKLQCALKLQRLSDMSLLMQQLETVELESYLKNEVNSLQHKLQELLMQPMVEHTSDTTNEEPKNVVKILNKRTKTIKKVQQNELLSTQQGCWFVPSGFVNVCFNCANSFLIPYPCHHCIGSVIYCSLKCKSAHECIHKFECKGFKLNILNLNSNHLYFCFHIVVQELPKAVPLLRSKRSAAKIWSTFMENQHIFAQNSELADYALFLKRRSCDKFQYDHGIYFCQLVNYLDEHTDYFQAMKNTAASLEDWKLIAGALMLRHSTQVSITDFQINTLGLPLEEMQHLFAKNYWCDALHLKRGLMHRLDYKQRCTGFAFFPFLSSCDHSCAANIYWTFNGTQLQIRANKEIQANEALKISYYLGHKEGMQSMRNILPRQRNSNAKCKCEICVSPNPDMDFLKYHRYRCENRRCRRVFIPKVPFINSPEWWKGASVMMVSTFVECCYCGHSQQYNNCLAAVVVLCEQFANQNSRLKLYACFEELNKFLLEYNELKTILYLLALRTATTQLLDGLQVSALDTRKLLNIGEHMKSATLDQFGELSPFHLRAVFYLCDIIALTKCQYEKSKMNNLLKTLKKIPGKIQAVIVNYYESYIQPQLI